ncbi:MAG: chorismate synthase [Planctomycetota bacterium]
MASNSFGELLRITTFGESHGPLVGVVVDGVPSGLPLTAADLEVELARRRPGQSEVTSQRREPDRPEIVSGVFEGRATGAPICVLVHNEDARPGDYDALRAQVRPGHADETWSRKYGHRDHRGGGRSSGRETVARVIGGVVARKILPPETEIRGHALRIGPVQAQRFDPDAIEQNAVRCADPDAAAAMLQHLQDLRAAGDSCGGVVEVRVEATPANLGEPIYGKVKARLADAFLSLGAVTGFEFGAGFRAADLRGSEYVAERAHFGGILGGVTTGEPLVLRAAVKPTSSIGAAATQGRHDPCIVPRVVPVLEAMTALVLADLWLLHRAGR